MRKIKQKQKQSQSTNINIKIGDTRRKRKRSTKSKTQKQNGAVPEQVRVVTQLVNAPVAPSTTPNLNNQVKQSDLLELLRKQLQLGEISGVQQLSDMHIPATRLTRPDTQTLTQPATSTPPYLSLDEPVPYATAAPFSQFAGAEASSSSSSMGMGSSLPSGAGLGKHEAEQVQEPENEVPPKPEDVELLPPGESISQASVPSLIMDLQSLKKPIYDTGLDFHYKVHGQRITDRIYLNANNKAFFYYKHFVNINTILSKAPRELLNSLLRNRQIIYDAEEKNKVYWVEVQNNE